MECRFNKRKKNKNTIEMQSSGKIDTSHCRRKLAMELSRGSGEK